MMDKFVAHERCDAGALVVALPGIRSTTAEYSATAERL